MADIFLSQDIKRLLNKKFMVIIGDSIQRAIYKDIVSMLDDKGNNYYLTDDDMRVKGEVSFSGDTLLKGGCQKGMTNGIDYCEIRQYRKHSFFVRFYFVTRCLNKKVEEILDDVKKFPPDIIMMNSCLWDLSRYGVNSWSAYQEKLKNLFDVLVPLLRPNCLFIWNSTLPVSTEAYGGFLGTKARSQKERLPEDILASNEYTYNLLKDYPFDFLDLHYYLRYHRHRLSKDGIHWDMTAHRRITNLIFTHISDSWGVPLPGRVPPQFHPCRLGRLTVAGTNNVFPPNQPPGPIFTGFGNESDNVKSLMNSCRQMSDHITYRRMHDNILNGRRRKMLKSGPFFTKSHKRLNSIIRRPFRTRSKNEC